MVFVGRAEEWPTSSGRLDIARAANKGPPNAVARDESLAVRHGLTGKTHASEIGAVVLAFGTHHF
jgi:hypothetical protein